MKNISNWKQFVKDAKTGTAKTERLPEEKRKKVLDYFHSQQDVAVACMLQDEITGKYTKNELFAFEVGDFQWTSSDIYYFENYDMPLFPEFLNTII